ncbi:hypothetical protein CCO03_14130 [Comamonas serinivorans]|uniref:CENP-V/GFA domain-containing protein n=1 Tax=Comamonas serinivorans TaxID=1082851 RepID=A0A1Y0EQG4_9BURK|nr:GFA family protein [Comamonas serinivorans]ARU05670.1 hypothetical protein CCO03_14130 [Comamonas serinivorans]
MTSAPTSSSTLHAGGCLCGQRRYRIAGELPAVVACHCSHCRRTSGSAYSLNLVLDEAQVSWDGLPPAAYADQPESGHTLERLFCDRCGSSLASRAGLMPGKLIVKLGSLDAPPADAPRMQVWTDSALPWAVFAGLPSAAKGR